MKRREFIKALAATPIIGGLFGGKAAARPRIVKSQPIGRSTDVTLGLLKRPDYGPPTVPGATTQLEEDFMRDVHRIVATASEGEAIGVNRAGMDFLVETAARWAMPPIKVRGVKKPTCGKLRLYEVRMGMMTDSEIPMARTILIGESTNLLIKEAFAERLREARGRFVPIPESRLRKIREAARG